MYARGAQLKERIRRPRPSANQSGRPQKGITPLIQKSGPCMARSALFLHQRGNIRSTERNSVRHQGRARHCSSVTGWHCSSVSRKSALISSTLGSLHSQTPFSKWRNRLR